MRTALAAFGVALAAYGGWLLVSRQHAAALVWVLVWLAAGVVLHDGVLAPVVAGLGRLWRRVPHSVAGAGVVVLVVLGSVTLVGVPVLGRFGARADDPTLLPRDYTTGWLVLAGVVLVAAAGVALARLRSTRSTRAGGRADGESPRGR